MAITVDELIEKLNNLEAPDELVPKLTLWVWVNGQQFPLLGISELDIRNGQIVFGTDD